MKVMNTCGTVERNSGGKKDFQVGLFNLIRCSVKFLVDSSHSQQSSDVIYVK